MMKHCTNCRKEISGDIKFCPSCGNLLTEHQQPEADSDCNSIIPENKKSINKKTIIGILIAIVSVIVVIIVVLFLTSNSPENLLTDNIWGNSDETCKFYSDGTFQIDDYTGKWELLDDNTLVIGGDDDNSYFEWETDWYVDSENLRIKNDYYYAVN